MYVNENIKIIHAPAYRIYNLSADSDLPFRLEIVARHSDFMTVTSIMIHQRGTHDVILQCRTREHAMQFLAREHEIILDPKVTRITLISPDGNREELLAKLRTAMETPKEPETKT